MKIIFWFIFFFGFYLGWLRIGWIFSGDGIRFIVFGWIKFKNYFYFLRFMIWFFLFVVNFLGEVFFFFIWVRE